MVVHKCFLPQGYVYVPKVFISFYQILITAHLKAHSTHWLEYCAEYFGLKKIWAQSVVSASYVSMWCKLKADLNLLYETEVPDVQD